MKNPELEKMVSEMNVFTRINPELEKMVSNMNVFTSSREVMKHKIIKQMKKDKTQFVKTKKNGSVSINCTKKLIFDRNSVLKMGYSKSKTVVDRDRLEQDILDGKVDEDVASFKSIYELVEQAPATDECPVIFRSEILQTVKP